MDKTVVHTLNSGLVLDRSVLVTLSSENISHIIAGIRAANGKQLYVIDGAEEFFKPTTLVALLGQKDRRALVCNEGLGGFFTDAQIVALTAQPQAVMDGAMIKPAAVHDPLIVNLGAQPDVAPAGYVFAKVPEGWSLSNNISLGQTKIRRKIKNSDNDGTLFAMTPEDFEKLWKFASKAWAGIEDAPLQSSFSTYQGKLKATVQDDRISLGGNYIRRYEIEQIAKYRHWAMPELQAA